MPVINANQKLARISLRRSGVREKVALAVDKLVLNSLSMLMPEDFSRTRVVYQNR
jgi:hypothetical protein